MAYVVHTTKKITEQVDLQSEISLLLYELYSGLAIVVQKLCVDSEKKYTEVGSSGNTMVCKQFIKTIHLMFNNLYQIAFKHQIDLKMIVKRQRQQSWMSSIGEKLNIVKTQIQTYINLHKEYQQLQKQYLKKSQIYIDVGANTIKYYSLHLLTNSKTNNEVIEMQLTLQKILLKLQSCHSLIQLLNKETNKLLFELVASKVKKGWQVVGFVRETLGKVLEVEDVIVQEGSRDYLTNLSEVEGIADIGQRQRGKSPNEVIKTAKKTLKNQEIIRNIFQQFVTKLILIFQSFSKKIKDNTHLQKLLLSLQRQKYLIQQNLSCSLPQSPHSLDLPHLIKIFSSFLSQITVTLKSCRFSKYKILQSQLLSRLQKELKSFSSNLPNGGKIQDNEQLYSYYVEMTMCLKRKYSKQAEEISGSFREEVVGIVKGVKELIHQFLDKQLKNNDTKPSSNKLQTITRTILSSKQYSIFQNPFILKPPSFQFTRSPHLNHLCKIKSQLLNNIDLSVDLSEQNQAHRSGYLQKVTCCGIKPLANSNNSDFIDEFNCALDDSILIQGKLILYKREIVFKSMFNKKTLFGKTQLKIPAKDIVVVQKQSAITNDISLYTQHGVIKFRCFLTDPLSTIINSYKFKSSKCRSEKHEVQEENVFKKISVVKKKELGLIGMVGNRFEELGFIKQEEMILRRQVDNLIQTVMLQGDNNQLLVKIQYVTAYTNSQTYKFKVTNNDSRLDIKYSLNDSPKRDFRDTFLNFVRSFMGKDEANIHNTRSQIFDISSIESPGEVTVEREKEKSCEVMREIERREEKEFVPILTQENMEKSDKSIKQHIFKTTVEKQTASTPSKPAQLNSLFLLIILLITASLILYS